MIEYDLKSRYKIYIIDIILCLGAVYFVCGLFCM